jgi:hypothetical protein
LIFDPHGIWVKKYHWLGKRIGAEGELENLAHNHCPWLHLSITIYPWFNLSFGVEDYGRNA